MNIIKVEVTYEDNSTFIVHPKLAPDVQGTSVEDLAPVEAPVVAETAPTEPEVAEPVAEVVEPAVETPAAE
jgi:hypothetical protein